MDETWVNKRARDVLAKLFLLSEAQSATYPEHKSQLHRTHPDSSPPPGFVDPHEHPQDGPPPKERSLYEHYNWHFSRAEGNPSKLLRLTYIAEQEYLEHAFPAHRSRVTVTEVKDLDGSSRAETFTEKRYRIVKTYVGWHPAQVHNVEGLSESFVRKARKFLRCDPTTGSPVEEMAA